MATFAHMLLINIFVLLAAANAYAIEGEWHTNQHHEIVELPILGNERAQQQLFNLPARFFPVLPPGHFWDRLDDQWIVRKNRHAPARETVVVTFGPDIATNKINFLTLIDKVNVQSFAHTRKEDPKITRHYPKLDFGKNRTTYDRGHCIDLRDTIPSTPNSNDDKRNYIPETPQSKSWWGRVGRRVLAGKLRKENGAYAQYPFYGENVCTTNDSTAIPEGVYFTELLPHRKVLHPIRLYEILWSNPPANATSLLTSPNTIFSTRPITHKKIVFPTQKPCLPPFSCYPVPLVFANSVIKNCPYEKWGTFYNNNPTIRRATEKALLNFSRAALLESKNASGKLSYLKKCLESKKGVADARWMLLFTVKHLQFLEEQGPLSPATLATIKKVSELLATNELLDMDHSHTDTLKSFVP